MGKTSKRSDDLCSAPVYPEFGAEPPALKRFLRRAKRLPVMGRDADRLLNSMAILKYVGEQLSFAGRATAAPCASLALGVVLGGLVIRWARGPVSAWFALLPGSVGTRIGALYCGSADSRSPTASLYYPQAHGTWLATRCRGLRAKGYLRRLHRAGPYVRTHTDRRLALFSGVPRVRPMGMRGGLPRSNPFVGRDTFPR
jgi:hypothetical protein